MIILEIRILKKDTGRLYKKIPDMIPPSIALMVNPGKYIPSGFKRNFKRSARPSVKPPTTGPNRNAINLFGMKENPNRKKGLIRKVKKSPSIADMLTAMAIIVVVFRHFNSR